MFKRRTKSNAGESRRGTVVYDTRTLTPSDPARFEVQVFQGRRYLPGKWVTQVLTPTLERAHEHRKLLEVYRGRRVRILDHHPWPPPPVTDEAAFERVNKRGGTK